MSEKLYCQMNINKESIPDYIKGRISGIIDGVICDPKRKRYAIVRINGLTIFRFDATKAQFNKIKKLMTTEYSNMYEINFIEL